MRVKHKQLLESYQRVQDFLAVYQPSTPAPKYAERKAELEATVARLNALLGDQSSGVKESRDDTRRQATLRRILRQKHLAPVSRIAKALLTEPEVRKALAMPDGGLSSMRLVAEATGFRNSATPYERLFVENGRPADFLAQLDAAIENLRASVLNRARSVGKHVGAGVGLKQTLVRARNCVLMLDAMVLDAFAGQDDIIAKWKVAKRVQDLPSPSVRGSTAAESEPPTTSPVAA